MTAPATTLGVEAPAGSHFEFDEVKTKKGTQTLGQRPLLVWDSLDAAKTFYGEDSILGILDGTSLRVSFQSIARRMAQAGKSDDDIAKAQVEFKPGTRVVGESTPVSRAARAARTAAEKLGGETGDTIAAFLARVANGDFSPEDLAELAGRQG